MGLITSGVRKFFSPADNDSESQEKQQQMYRRTPILFRILDSFFRHQLLFWSALVLVSGLTMTALYARSKTFHASAMTQVQSDSIASILGTTDQTSYITPAQKHVDRFNDLIKDNQPGGFLDEALKKATYSKEVQKAALLDLTKIKGMDPTLRQAALNLQQEKPGPLPRVVVDPTGENERYTTFLKGLSVSADSANQFAISLTWDNGAEAENILYALQTQYVKEVGVDRTASSTGSVVFLNDEIKKAEKRLTGSENALSAFKTSFGGKLTDTESSYSNQITSDEADLANEERDADKNARTAAALKEQLADMKPMNIAEQTVSEQSPLQKEIADLLAHRATVLASRGGLTPEHPDVVAIDNQIKILEGQERSSADAPQNKHNMMTKMQDNPQYQSLKLNIVEAEIGRDEALKESQNLRQRLAKNRALFSQIPNAERNLSDKMRDYTEANAEDQRLRKRLGEVQLQMHLDNATASDSLLPVGVIYAMPTTGKTKLIAMLLGSLLLGCLVGIILVVLSEWSDHSLRFEGDAERLLGVPILAALPDSSELRTSARRALSGAGMPALPGPAPEG